MNRKELIELLDKYEIEYEVTNNTKEVEEGLRLLDEALEKIGIIIPKETQVDNITIGNAPEVPKYTTEWANSSDLVFRQATILPAEPELVSGDTISKEALIQSFLADCECKDRSEAKAVTCSLDTMLELIDDAPPVEPPKKVIAQIKVDTEEIVERIKEEYEITDRPEIIRCKSCRHDNNCEIQYAAQAGNKFFCGAAERQEGMSSVEPKRSEGEWIEVEVFPEVYDIEGVKTWGSEMQCDQCGFRFTAIEGRIRQYNFCPNCGRPMINAESDD